MRIVTSVAVTTVILVVGYASASEVSGSTVRSQLRLWRLCRSTQLKPPCKLPISEKADADIRQALCRELEEARY
jgi:hypothetical protein